MIQMSKGVV